MVSLKRQLVVETLKEGTDITLVSMDQHYA
jgi:hypothetical protein